MNRSMWHKLAILGLAVALGAAGAALAQEETGNVYVVVSDAEGSPLPGVTVTLAGYGAPQVQVTNARGEARFLSLSPGSWNLTAELEGFSTVEYPNIDVRVARNTTLEVTLSAAVEEVITVTSESPLLDERKVTTGTTVSQVELEKIPTARDPWSLLSQTPGVMVDRINVGGNESGQQAVFQAPGVSSDENAFLVDGVEITDMSAVGASSTYYDFDQFTEMQFTTGGTDVTKAAAGVSVNLVTKRGTNEFRGSARFLRTDDNFFNGFLEQDVPRFTQPNSDLDPDQFELIGNTINQVTEYGFEAGGPLVQDRLWAWGSFGNNDIRNRTVGGCSVAAAAAGCSAQSQVQADDTILENTALKVNAQLSSANSLVASWNNGDKKKFGRNAGPTRPFPTTWDQRGPSAIYKIEDTHVFSSNFFLSGTYSYVDGGFSLTAKSVVAAGSLEAAPETAWDAGGVWQNSYASGNSPATNEEIKLDGSYFFNTGNASHELKFGGRLRTFEGSSAFHWPGGRDLFVVDLGLFGVPGNFEWAVAHRGEGPPISQDYTSIWGQDTISIGNLTINGGLRYDLQEGTNEPFQVAGSPFTEALFAAGEIPVNFLPALNYAGADAPFEWEDISPRLGLTYALGEERKTLLRGSFSQFPEQLSTDDIDNLNPVGNAYGYFYFYDLNEDLHFDDTDEFLYLGYFSGFDPDNPTALVSPNQTASDYEAPVTSEVVLGVEHAFLPEFVMGLQYTYRLTEDLVSEERNIIQFADGSTRPVTAADYVLDSIVTAPGDPPVLLPDGSNFAVPLYSIGCIIDGTCSITGGTLRENTDREIEANGVSVNFIKRLSNRWMARGYFSWGEGEWGIGDEYVRNYDPTDHVVTAVSNGDDNDGQLVGTVSGGSGNKGDVILQSTWSYNLNGMYQVAPDRPWGFNVAANLFGREGTPLPYFIQVTGSDGITKSLQVTDLDDFRTDDILTIDLRLEKEFAATGNVGFTFSLDAFNLLDETYVLQRERRVRSGSLGRTDFLDETLSPRIYRLGVRLNWR